MKMTPNESCEQLALSVIPTGKLVAEILRRGGARLYGNVTGIECFWVRISLDAFAVKERPECRAPIPDYWGSRVGISDMEENYEQL